MKNNIYISTANLKSSERNGKDNKGFDNIFHDAFSIIVLS